MRDVARYLVRSVNQGPWLTAYTLAELRDRIGQSRLRLPIASLGTPVEEFERLAENADDLLLPPLYREALRPPSGGALERELLERIRTCFPYYAGTRERRAWKGQFEVVELDKHTAGSSTAHRPGRMVGFSVDTAVEEHGPHLPLATDTIQSYAVLEQLEASIPEFELAPPVEYGHLTWGLPFGLSIDITPRLLTSYVRNYIHALIDWLDPRAVYVVDVHGSIVHRQAIESGMAASRAGRSRFRWLHEPLVAFAGDRGDQHAGGVETALIELISPELIDSRFWPAARETLIREQMPMQQAIDLSQNLDQFIEHVQRHGGNGVVGDLRNYDQLDAHELMNRMLDVARNDVDDLRGAAG